MTESEIQQQLQIEAVHHKCWLMRNNSGAFKDETGRVVRFGLGNVSKRHSEHMKSSDLIGVTEVVITPDMVGKTIGVITAFEVKNPEWKHDKKFDKHEMAQANFIRWIKAKGGIAGFLTSIEDLKHIFGK